MYSLMESIFHPWEVPLRGNLTSINASNNIEVTGSTFAKIRVMKTSITSMFWEIFLGVHKAPCHQSLKF